MSVLKRNRKESTLEFINTAIELEIFTIKQVIKFPKRYQYIITNDILRLTKDCLFNVKSANEIYPTNKIELEIRTKYLLDAKCNISNLYTQIDILIQLCEIEIKEQNIIKWMELITKEEQLIKSLLKKDKERFCFNN